MVSLLPRPPSAIVATPSRDWMSVLPPAALVTNVVSGGRYAKVMRTKWVLDGVRRRAEGRRKVRAIGGAGHSTGP